VTTRQNLAIAILAGLAAMLIISSLVMIGSKALLRETNILLNETFARTQEREAAKQAGSTPSSTP
jgi:hypothetical protein